MVAFGQQYLYCHAILCVEFFELIATFGVVHAAIGHNAIDIQHKELDVVRCELLKCILVAHGFWFKVPSSKFKVR